MSEMNGLTAENVVSDLVQHECLASCSLQHARSQNCKILNAVESIPF